MVIAPQFSYAADFSEGLAVVQQNGRYGYINPQGEWIVEPQYANAGRFSEGHARVQIGPRWGFIDAEGTVLTGDGFKGFN